MASRLTLTVLVDNTTLTDHYFNGEPGLSFLLETEGKKILFDTGYSGMFVSNAEKMGISLLDVDYVVLSHGHLDHTGGLVSLVRLLTEAKNEGIKHRVPQLIAHPRCFYAKEKIPQKNSGSLLGETEIRRRFPVNLSAAPVWITDNLVFLGEIPRISAFEKTDSKDRILYLPSGVPEPDQMLDDSALAFRSKEGLVIITGCSHAGICNITGYAQKVCVVQQVQDIIGGFHLLNASPEQLDGTCRYLEKIQPASVHACHCTSLAARIALAGHCPVKETGVGQKLAW